MAGNIDQRGKDSYRLTVSGGYDSNGKRIYHRKTIKATSPRAAEKELAKFVAEVENGQYITATKQTFEEFSKFWLVTYARKNLRISTVHGYEQMLNTRILQAIGHIPLEKLKPIHLQSFYSNLQENGIRLDGKPGGLSARTVKHYHNCISSILQSAVEWQLIRSNAANNVKTPKIEDNEADYYTEEEVKEILACLANEDVKYYVLYSLAITTGLRKGELLGLEWDHIDFEKKELTVKQTSMYRHGVGIYKDVPKTKKSMRTLSLSDTEIKLLKHLKEVQTRMKEEVGDLWVEHNRLFTQWNGMPMHPNTPNNMLKKFLKKYGFPTKSFHSLRHTNITILLANNIDFKTVISRAGHSDGIMTINRYAHALKSKDVSASNLLEKKLFY
ncbi:tyrosine-type recombinase/integrase [Calidifontibacillus oryziterrae]|uniref:tyrosine-type recombinase/integrase n=1 Tax=Calidifontibacillus oryziterrae TaxID=1191699 RepID=UPI0003086343|nr:site-specific integrase [Calidifontibacillus oryziterrae]